VAIRAAVRLGGVYAAQAIREGAGSGIFLAYLEHVLYLRVGIDHR
jgi:hypothetical protein